MKIRHTLIDTVLRDEIAWHRTKTAAQATGYTFKERRAFIRGLRQSRLLLAKIVKELRTQNRKPTRQAQGAKCYGCPNIWGNSNCRCCRVWLMAHQKST